MQAGGRRFDPAWLHHLEKVLLISTAFFLNGFVTIRSLKIWIVLTSRILNIAIFKIIDCIREVV